MVQQQGAYMIVLIQKVGSGISRAAANRNNPLHWISGGHTHVYPRCDNDESAPITPSAAAAASSDAGIASVVSSIDDSALKGTPRSPGHVTYSKSPFLARSCVRANGSVVHRVPAYVFLSSSRTTCFSDMQSGWLASKKPMI